MPREEGKKKTRNSLIGGKDDGTNERKKGRNIQEKCGWGRGEGSMETKWKIFMLM